MQPTNVTHEYAENNLGETGSAMVRSLAVISQREALVFQSEEKGSVPERLQPFDPDGDLRRLKHTIGADASARSAENFTYYKEIAATLAAADEILLMGNGSGSSSAMHHFKDFLETHHAEIAKKVVGTLTVDIESLTEGQLLQQARAFFLHHPRLGS